MQSLTTTFYDKQKTSEVKFNKETGTIEIHTAKMENKTTNRAKMSNKRCIKARLQYLQRGYKASEATSRATCFALL